jgi:hypothetical protein
MKFVPSSLLAELISLDGSCVRKCTDTGLFLQLSRLPRPRWPSLKATSGPLLERAFFTMVSWRDRPDRPI